MAKMTDEERLALIMEAARLADEYTVSISDGIPWRVHIPWVHGWPLFDAIQKVREDSDV